MVPLSQLRLIEAGKRSYEIVDNKVELAVITTTFSINNNCGSSSGGSSGSSKSLDCSSCSSNAISSSGSRGWQAVFREIVACQYQAVDSGHRSHGLSHSDQLGIRECSPSDRLGDSLGCTSVARGLPDVEHTIFGPVTLSSLL